VGHGHDHHHHPHDHGHDHSHGHAHGHDHHGHGHAHGFGHHHHHGSGSRRALALSLAFTVAYGIVQVVSGFLFHSLALLADSAHNISDGASIGLALIAAWAAGLPVTGARTFGWKRVEVLAALVNGLALVVLGALILVEGVLRLAHPAHVTGWGVAAVGAVGVLANGLPTLWMWRASRGREDINLRGALIHSATDVLGSLGAVTAGVLAATLHLYRADPVIAIGIGSIVIWSSWGLIRDATRIVLEIAPADCTPERIGPVLAAHEGVVEVHDLHIWTITSGFPLLSAHVVVKQSADCHAVRRELEAVIQKDFSISHTTLQVDHHQPTLIELGPTPKRATK
jgi:cobalt-zinc-cadmium efflux system protein